MRQNWLSRARSYGNRAKARPLPLLGHAVLAGSLVTGSLAGCSMLPDVGRSDAPLGATVTSNGVETKYQRDDLGGKKMATMDASDSSFAGALVADEPTAALAARNILESGGNAADAATALYFALSVTYPAAAGLGGGGVCLARASDKATVESISFLVRQPIGGGSFGIPGNVRGFALLQAKYGSKPWAELVSPAERLAAAGFPVSRATGRQLADGGLAIVNSPDLQRLFTADGSRSYRELDNFAQVSLATTLAHIRSRGIGGFYSGETAQQLIAESHAKGGSLSSADLLNYRPEIAPAQQMVSDNVFVALPARNLGSGAFAGALWSGIQGSSGDALTEVANKTARSLGASTVPLDSDFGTTSFAVVDGKGGAVACAVTMNGAFGSGQAAEGTGVVFASSPSSPKGLASAFLAPVLILNTNNKNLYFAGAGGGAPKGAASIEHAAQAALADGNSALGALQTSPADARSPAAAIMCPTGLPEGSCSLGISPKSDGVGFGAVASGS